MRLYEIIGDWLISTAIVEQALRRSEVESKITGLADPVIEHLIKILKWEDARNYNKHITDVNNWLRQIQRLYIKGNKKPTQRDYYKWLFEDNIKDERDIQLWIAGLTSYYSLPVLQNDIAVYDAIKAILYNVSFDLTVNEVIDIRKYISK